MFTGIIETKGRLAAIEAMGAMTRLWLELPLIHAELGMGESVAINGACLTVAAIEPGRIAFDAVRETLEKTALGELAVGDHVHIERAMRADGRLDGHIVQGHVDEVGRVSLVEQAGADVRVHVRCSESFASLLVDKGSVAINGVSLTVCDVLADGFHVVLIPHTLKETMLGEGVPGFGLNLEADVLGKYVKKYLDRIQPGA